jgi:hypothetical protein
MAPGQSGRSGAMVRFRTHANQSFVPDISDTVTAGATDTAGNGQSFQQNVRFNPVFDRLEQGSVLEDWVPRDAAGINMMFRRMYVRDPIVKPVIDIQSTMPWSEFDIGGVKDPAIRNFYEDAFAMWTSDAMSQISREYLVLGRFCASLLYDAGKGYWTDYVPHDPDFLEIQPVPFHGWNPIIDVRSSPAMRLFMTSPDERVRRIRSMIPDSYISKYRATGRIPLDQFGTLFLPRSISPTDHVGTSSLTSVVSIWAIEKALMDATVTAARRKIGSILHVTCGIDDVWEPDDTELDNYAALFTQTDEDPVGAVIATRTGVQPQEVRQGGQIWKISDEWAFLTEAKMRALGVSEALLSGESTFSNMESSRTLMVEQILNFRNQLTTRMFGWMAKVLARAHGFVTDPKRAASRGQIRVKRDLRVDFEEAKSAFTREARIAMASAAGRARVHALQDEARQRLRLGGLSMHDALKIPEDTLITPTIHWRKEMKPTQDQAYIELLEKMEEKGLPVPKRIWAAAGGYDLEAAIEMMDEDRALTKRIEQASSEPAAEGPAGEAPEDQVDEKPVKVKGPGPGPAEKEPEPEPTKPGPAAKPPAPPPAREVSPEKPPVTKPSGSPDKPAPPADVKPRRNPLASIVRDLPVWRDGQLGGVKRAQVVKMAERLERSRGHGAVDLVVGETVPVGQRDVVRYVLARAGAGLDEHDRIAMDDQAVARVSRVLCEAGLPGSLLIGELTWLARVTSPVPDAQQVARFVEQARTNGHAVLGEDLAPDNVYRLSGMPVKP